MKKRLKIVVVIGMLVNTIIIFNVDTIGVLAATSTCETVEECALKKSELAAQKEAKVSEIEAAKADVSKQSEALFAIGSKREILEEEIAVLEKSLPLLSEQNTKLIEEIALKDKVVSSRLTTLQKQNNQQTFLTLLTSSKSIGELMKRWSALEYINKQDKQVIREFIETKKALEETIKEQEADKIRLEESKNAILKIEEEEENQLKELSKRSEELEKQIQDIVLSENEVNEQQKAAEDHKEKMKREEEERKRKEEEANKPNLEKPGESGEPENPGSPENHGVEPEKPTPPPVAQKWFLPAAKGWVSCEMWCYENHIGTDFAMPEWTELYSVARGQVIYTSSGYSGGFGNMIVIYHYVDGVDYVTIYAHLNEINVSVGQSVDGGQFIGYSGNTGASQGAHLHLELLVNIDYYPGSKAKRMQHAQSILEYVPGSWKWNW